MNTPRISLTCWIALALCAAIAHEEGRAQTVTLTASPASLTFTYQAGAATLPAVQNSSVHASVGAPNFTTAITNGSLWMTVSPDSGKMPATIAVHVNPTGLGPGTYSDSVTVTTTGAAPVTATIPVTLDVTSPPPALSISSTALAFVSPPSPPAAQTVRLSTTGGPISFTANVAGASWLTAAPSSGVLLPGEIVTLTVSVDASSLNPQAAAYTGRIAVTATGVAAANKQQNITVSLTVNAVTPAITTIWPAGIQVNSPATTITLRGTNFYSGTTIQATGTPSTNLAATIISPTAVQAVIPATLLTTPGTLNIVATNPAPGGSSAPVNFVVSTTPVVQAIVNDASYAAGAVSPGELVTLFGTGIGPATPGGMQSTVTPGFVDTTVNNTSVTIDNQPCPIIYVSLNQIDVQVPYEVTQGSNKTVAVTSGTTVSTGAVNIVPTIPGIFSSDGSGSGQAAAFTVTASTGAMALNSAANPAHIGDAVVLYLTGEGDYATSISPRTGLLITSALNPLPQLNPLPTVTIGGVAAAVTYAGPVVGSIIGLLQVNATVPAGATTGAAVPVVVTIGANSTQAGVTLAIHP